MPPPVNRTACKRLSDARAHSTARHAARALLLVGLACAFASCRTGDGSSTWTSAAGPEQGIYPPAPQSPRVVALGNLQSGPGPTPTEVKVSMFLFGTEPEPALAFVRPTDVAASGDHLVVCDGGLAALLTWNPTGGVLSPLSTGGPGRHPSALSVTPDGELLVTDPDAGLVCRLGPDGAERVRYKPADGEFRPADAIQIDDQVWVTNVARHAVEVFDAKSGSHTRSFGVRGAGPLEFGMPMGMARCPNGEVCIVDVLNARVQVVGADGRFVRALGAPGDVAGRFGRPRDVAVGPDGTVFVTDGASQRVHAFDAQGRVLLAFGDQRDPIGGLSMPNGICIVKNAPTGRALPPGFVADYYVCVAEQLLRPGIRVYAWGRNPADTARDASRAAPVSTSAAPNPHWSAARCGECHRMDGGRPMPIARADVDAVCLNCHDGRRARAEAHPIGRPAITASVSSPKDWPTSDGLINCLTCHDIQRHCTAGPTRPAVNPGMLRHHNPDRPLDFCLKCHTAEETWRISPHRQVDAGGAMKAETCAFCHTSTPPIPPDGNRRNSPALHAEGSTLCLTCHTRHWDVSPRGHVDRPVPPAFLQAMQARPAPPSVTRTGAGPQGPSVADLLPLASGKVTCYTCHNPHDPGLFPAAGVLGVVATQANDKPFALRAASTHLCLSCHEK